jgi:hypothetical protein
MTRSAAQLTRRALLTGLAAAPLAACGIRGPNRPPENADPDYPRTYPPRDSVRPRRGEAAETSDEPADERGDQ